MENLRSKRRPVVHRDEVDEAIEKMGRKWKYNPFRQKLGSWIILTLVIFFLWSYFAPMYQAGGTGGVASNLVQMAMQLMFAAVFALFQIYIMFFAIARPRTFWLKPGETGITFNDYKGNPQVLEMAREVVMLLKGTKEFKQMGGEVIRGLLLEGDPGVGKSYLAQAIATEAGLPFGYCSAASLQSPFVAGGMLSIKALYKKANKLADQHGACILFLDEIDAIGQKRNGGNQGGGMMGGGMMGGMMGGGSGLINELLVQMDPPPVFDGWKRKFLRWLGLDLGSKKAVRRNVLTIGATNLVQTLDEALLRPGRFDRKITVDLPDSEGRREIIEYYLDRVNHENVPIDRFVYETIGYTPVAIRYVINEAVVRAHFDGRDAVTYRDLIAARDLHEYGLRQPIRGMSRDEKRNIAYHEVGHAISQLLLKPHERIVKLTIIRHGDALGFMAPKPKDERNLTSKDEMEAEMQVFLASRAAEEIFLGTVYNGFYGDLMGATQIAVSYCNLLGMNGHLSSSRILGDGAVSVVEVEGLLKVQYQKVKSLLLANQDVCHALAAELIEKEELLGDEIMAVVDKYEHVLTNDAREIGFRLSRKGSSKPQQERYGGVYSEPRVAASSTGGIMYGDSDDGVVFPGAVASKTPPTVRNEIVAPLNASYMDADEDDLLPRRW
jgi:ATP-dependent Zn protease